MWIFQLYYDERYTFCRICKSFLDNDNRNNNEILFMRIIQWFKDKWRGNLGGLRNPKWAKVRNEFLLFNPLCEVCGSNKHCEIHHIIPFNINPTLELVKDNLITLCESKKNGVNCHLFFGHLGNYQKFDTKVKEDTKNWNNKLKGR
mgnify:CR=1 FL=1